MHIEDEDEPSHCEATRQFVFDLQAACQRAANADICGDCLSAALVETVAVMLAQNFRNDRPMAQKLARRYSALLRDSTTEFLKDIGGVYH